MHGSTRPAALLILALLLAAAAPDVAGAVRAGADPGLPNVDLRSRDAAPVPAATVRARRELERDLGPLADVRTDRASGGVAQVGTATCAATQTSSG